jgi:hypothetical protein
MCIVIIVAMNFGGRGEKKSANRGIRNGETGRIVYQHCEQKWM